MIGDADSSYVPLLRGIRLIELAGERIDEDELAQSLSSTPFVIDKEIALLERWGLLYGNRLEKEPPFILRAGHQYIERDGEVEEDLLQFLPIAIDDLNTRKALLEAGTALIDQFVEAAATDDMIEYARSLVPEAFEQVVDDQLALKLFAAAVALVARLASNEPAGCLAEEIVAVELLNEAEAVLEDQTELGQTTPDEEQAARRELAGLFEFFQDDDVLAMFDMKEPADAAVALHAAVNQQMGVADQRVEAWFNAFGGVAVTGHLARHTEAE